MSDEDEGIAGTDSRNAKSVLGIGGVLPEFVQSPQHPFYANYSVFLSVTFNMAQYAPAALH